MKKTSLISQSLFLQSFDEMPAEYFGIASKYFLRIFSLTWTLRKDQTSTNIQFKCKNISWKQNNTNKGFPMQDMTQSLYERNI